MTLLHSAGFILSRMVQISRYSGFSQAIKLETARKMKQDSVEIFCPPYNTGFWLRPKSSDVEVFVSTLVQKELSVFENRSVSSILDCGANNGATALYLAKAYPGARLLAVEPSDENVGFLRKNTATCANVSILVGGVWPESGFLRITNPDDEPWAYRCELVKEQTPKSFRAYTIGELIAMFDNNYCDLLKMDVEGAEHEIFARNCDWLEQVGMIAVEAHTPAAVDCILAACTRHGFQHRVIGDKQVFIRPEKDRAG